MPIVTSPARGRVLPTEMLVSDHLPAEFVLRNTRLGTWGGGDRGCTSSLGGAWNTRCRGAAPGRGRCGLGPTITGNRSVSPGISPAGLEDQSLEKNVWGEGPRRNRGSGTHGPRRNGPAKAKQSAVRFREMEGRRGAGPQNGPRRRVHGLAGQAAACLLGTSRPSARAAPRSPAAGLDEGLRSGPPPALAAVFSESASSSGLPSRPVAADGVPKHPQPSFHVPPWAVAASEGLAGGPREEESLGTVAKQTCEAAAACGPGCGSWSPIGAASSPPPPAPPSPSAAGARQTLLWVRTGAAAYAGSRGAGSVPRTNEVPCLPVLPAMLSLTFLLLVTRMLWPIVPATALSAQDGRAGDLPCGEECADCALLAQELGTPRPAPGNTEAALHRATTSQRSDWDNPSCTEGVVSVSRGERAVMSCNISNPFLGVTVYLIALGEDSQPLFRVTPPGCFCRGEWQLRVRGGVAQLVIPKASDAQAGRYKWHLKGLQRNIKVTTLDVLASGAEAQDLNQTGVLPLTSSCGPQMPCPGWAERQLQVVLVVTGVSAALAILVVTVLAWRRRHSPLYLKPPGI
ncbi:secreted and transmembrane protein 1 [Leopardus geoffroyi]|uniref:secreted and transmembrane protein 1 n=1 Tax=Leopardus geoffroyi TaxID=46844 RepID=UPI001E2629FA|nr:secreted and transmembrane protein 1 [Leopardus geoffroyi]